MREQLSAVAKRIPFEHGVLCHKLDYHVTLAFVGGVDSTTEQCLERAAQKVVLPAFDFDVRRLGCFSTSKILWVGPEEYLGALSNLAIALQRSLELCGYRPQEKTYIPHVSLIRKAEPRSLALSFTPIKWRVTEFCLVESVLESEPKYHVLKKFPLSD